MRNATTRHARSLSPTLAPARLAVACACALALIACTRTPSPAADAESQPVAAPPVQSSATAPEPAAQSSAPVAIGEGVSDTGIDLAQVMAQSADAGTSALASGFDAPQSGTASTSATSTTAPSTATPPSTTGATDPAAQGSTAPPGDDPVIDQTMQAPPAKAAAADAKVAQDAPLRVQVLLDRAFFSPGEIDGAVGSNQARALTAYQKAHGLDPSGKLDTATWDKLRADTAPILVEYALTEADIAGPYRETPQDTMAKAALDALPYASVEEAIGERFHASPALLRKLNPDADFTKAGTVLAVPNVATADALPDAERVVVSKSLSALQLVDEGGKVLAQFPVTTGSAQFPLPIGEWKINGVARNPVWHFDPKLIAGAKKTDKKAKIPAGPNNPVGTTWIDLSKDHYGIHGTAEPAKIGKSESNGCVRMTNWTVQALAKVVSPGMAAVLEE